MQAGVYFIRADNGLVKIGHSSDVARRLANLRLANAGDLDVFRVIDGGRQTERWLHKRFHALRIRGEWFEFHPDTTTVVPPDEIPSRNTIQPQLRLTLAEALRDADESGMFSSNPRLLAITLVDAMWDEDLADFIAWVRDRCS